MLFIALLGILGAIGWVAFEAVIRGSWGFLFALPVLILPIPVLAAMFSEAWYDRPRRQLESRFCLNCEYDLTGNVSGRCPECGTKILR